MELSEVVNTQYAFPVGFVLICAVLVFAFGFKSAQQPEFAQLTHSSDDRKPAGKKRKVKDKKSQSNGHVSVPSEDGSESKQRNVEAGGGSLSSKQDKEKSPAKESRRGLREKKQELESSPKDNNKNRQQKSRSKGKENQIEDVKNKKNEKNLAKLKKQVEKPLDFDEGEWESVSRKDKKIRKKDDMFEDSTSTKKESPSKKKKLAKNQELITLDNKVVFDVKENAEVNDKTTEKNEEVKQKEDEDKPSLTKKGDKIKEKKAVEIKEYIEAKKEELIDHVESIVGDELVSSAAIPPVEDITSSEAAVKVKKIKKKKPTKTETELTISETTPEVSSPSEGKE
uniref:Triadin n=1 Tax=Timema genevievae TaxID=629358 RepID=A0A7R9PNK9_TIMGE|nr:unnamed protein product [Timema genevievae]